jgi:hypothetical protein
MNRLLVLALLAACSGPKDAFECTSNASCRFAGATGTCESTGFCSFPDSSCPDGSRYGTAAGSLSNQCVGAGGSGDGGTGGDGAVDVAPHPLGTWANSITMDVPRYSFAAAQAGPIVYIAGGIQGSTNHSDVWFATGNPNAVLPTAAVSTWTSTTSLPSDRRTFAAAYDAGYVYLFGGRVDATDDTPDVLSAPVNGNSTLGSWTTTTAMPLSVKCEAVASSGPNVYMIGGKSNLQPQSLVLRAQMANGVVSGWQVAATLDTTVFNGAAAVVNGYLYVIGGCATGKGMCSQFLDIVEVAKINADGSLGAFSHTASLPMVWWHHSAAVSGNGDIYVLGGSHDQIQGGGPAASDVVAAHPNPDGSIGAWHAMTPLPTPRIRAFAAVIGNDLVLVQDDTQAVTIQ